jgi:hypothetical protein
VSLFPLCPFFPSYRYATSLLSFVQSAVDVLAIDGVHVMRGMML